MLPRREPSQQCERLGAAQGFSCGPLHKSSTEELCSRSFGQHAHLESIHDSSIAASFKPKILWSHMSEQCSQIFRSAVARLHYLPHPCDQPRTNFVQRVVAHRCNSRLCCVFRAIDIPVAKCGGITVGTLAQSIQQHGTTVGGIYIREVHTMRP